MEKDGSLLYSTVYSLALFTAVHLSVGEVVFIYCDGVRAVGESGARTVKLTELAILRFSSYT